MKEFLQSLQDHPLQAVADYYASCLPENPKAADYAARFNGTPGIGFADRTLGRMIPHKRTKIGRQIRESLQHLGIYKANGRETLRGYVTEPIRDGDAVIGIRGHKLDRHTAGDAVIVVGGGVEPAPAEPLPITPPTDPDPQPVAANDEELTIEEGQVVFRRENRRYRIRGLEKNASTTTLRVSLMASRDGLVHLDSLDLVKARSRASFVKATATELYVDEDIVKRDIGTLLLKLETVQAQRIEQLKQTKVVELSEAEEAEAMVLLRDPNLLDRIAGDLDEIGIVGERTNKIAGYLAAVSRKLDSPLAIVIQSSSAAGKTSLMDAVLSLVPDEDLLRLSNLSSQSLYYLDSIRHKILAVSEDEGVSEATYALKLLQSEGVLRHAVVGKGDGGRMTTQHYTVEGPVSLFLTTTAVELDEELVNRCLVLSVDESRQQTEAIHRQQQLAETVKGGQAAERAAEIRRLHQNAQRLIRPLRVFNPYADKLTFPSDRTRMRRDHAKYLSLIKAVALLHQHQRRIEDDSIFVTREDIAIANRLAGEILGRSLDELSPQTRCFLIRLHDFVKRCCEQQDLHQAEFRFTRRDVRQSLGWTDFQVHTHLSRLSELEYVLVHRGKRGRSYVYELLYGGEGQGGSPFLMGLVDAAKL